MGQGVLLERGGVWEQRLLDGPIHNKEGGGGRSLVEVIL